ncbi:gamma-glutamyltransferase [Pseudochelatococcus contaminans]|uniref:Glutathione hydrolase proenzyme n=1 Tax=Pseudochelatococcus contaminans TaxID=1538103 RepID=A0A7W6EF13_9HYPH|nr:gamma-glutamyltransferase [Pseudochelatococcus contaminans]MBB3808057.1 gamma-glutamyltranspeptidase/glutathione hydrolase [Pseudochelatococcus contaminans]
MTASWRQKAAVTFATEKHPARSRDGMVVTNHPLASAAGAEMLAAGGNAVDAAIAALFALSVVEPMMVGIVGGGMAQIRMADGRHVVLDGQSRAPGAAHPAMFRPTGFGYEVEGRANTHGATAVATPGTLRGWCDALERFGVLKLADVMAPAIRHARSGFAVTPYLAACLTEAAHDLAQDAEARRILTDDGAPLPAGHRLVMADYAETLQLVAAQGPDALYTGDLGGRIVDALQAAGSVMTREDLASVETVTREPVRGFYRGHEIVGPPPPSAGGVHVIQMLKILEGFDLACMGFGSIEAAHLTAEVLRIAFADRAAATADPAFVEVPVARLISDGYAAERRARIDPDRTQAWQAGVGAVGEAHTTHVTVADRDGNIVSTTQTINALFGARIIIPGTGIIPNNYMALFDPVPGRANSIAPGKRVTTSMAPTIVLKDGKPRYAIGLPGGLRIFGSVMQALVNLLEYGMSLQEAVEAPRLWTQGAELELEDGFPPAVEAGLQAKGWQTLRLPHVGGGMNAIAFDDRDMEGAACWRADGVAIGLGGGLARAGTRFWPDSPAGR